LREKRFSRKNRITKLWKHVRGKSWKGRNEAEVLKRGGSELGRKKSRWKEFLVDIEGLGGSGCGGEGAEKLYLKANVRGGDCKKGARIIWGVKKFGSGYSRGTSNNQGASD